MAIPDIQELIPHRPPMLLVDRIVELDVEAKHIVARKNIRDDEYFLQGHYPDDSIVPGIITCECIFQSGAALLSALFRHPEDPKERGVPLIARIGKAKFSGMIRPGDCLQLEAELLDQVGPAYYLKGSASVDGTIKVTVEFTCMTKPFKKETQ